MNSELVIYTMIKGLTHLQILIQKSPQLNYHGGGGVQL